jgi:hypothetical protein
MSDIDDLEEIAEQCRYGVNDPKHGVTKGQRMAWRRAGRHSAAKQRSVGKQQLRSSERRGVLATLPESVVNDASEVPGSDED